VEKESSSHTLALVGNPNCGKTSIFNQLTGLQQKVGNFPGVTVDKKVGQLRVGTETVQLMDLPGTYSLYPNSKDERIVAQTLINPSDENHPDAVIYVADVTKIEKHLLLFSQVQDLGIPTLLVLNMADVAEKEGIEVDLKKLSQNFGISAIIVSGRTGKGLDQLSAAIQDLLQKKERYNPDKAFYIPTLPEKKVIKAVRSKFPIITTDYQALLLAHHYEWLPFLSIQEKEAIAGLQEKHAFESIKQQVNETMDRYNRIAPILYSTIHDPEERDNWVTRNLDRWLTHRIAGPIIFFVIMALVFQAIFTWATIPMDGIEAFFGWMGGLVSNNFPGGWLTDLITDGILAGLGGILVFVPQIAILFFLISVLEEVGYMARAAFMFDRIMQFFGLNGKSVVALISGGACAIPAVMSTRTISNWKERLITILVTPLISCSARIPVYIVLIGFVVPPTRVAGIFDLQGLAFMGLYLLGIVAALFSAFVFKLILKSNERSFLMLELPEYRMPVMRNVWLTVWEKVRTFAWEAGKVIFVISIVLWVLAYFGPSNKMQLAEQAAIKTAQDQNLDETTTANLIASQQLEASYAGHIGKFIEPAIEPLGFDWKIGIALITSFAAREVFVGTMATIYSIGSEEDETTIRNKMAAERNPLTGELVYTAATSLSLLIFYVFAMQCMSTLAVVKRETNSWKWPIVQFLFMSAMAYFGSLLVFQLMT
jgi:ferrous iron transport protein B